MPRWVQPPSTQPSGPEREGWVTRIAKYVPGEIVATFVIVVGTIASIPGDTLMKQIMGMSFLGLFFAGTYLWVALKMPAGKIKTAHFVISPFAFLAWGYPIASGLLGNWFIGLVAAGLQGVVLLMSIFFPIEESGAAEPAFA